KPQTVRERARSSGSELRRRPVRERLGEVLGQYLGGSGEQGDRPGHPRHASPAPPGEREPIDRSRQQLLGGARQPRYGRVERRAPGEDAGPYRLGALAGRRGELGGARSRERDDEVEAVEERARELVAVAVELLWRARAARTRIAAHATRTEGHRPPEDKARGIEPPTADTGDRHRSLLERLSERLEHRPRELGKLVEHQDATVSKRHLAGPRARAAADDRGRRRRVMRCPERRRPDETSAWRQDTGDRVDARDFEGRLVVERRQDPRQPPGEHRLPDPGRPGKQQVVTSGGGDLEHTAGPVLP